jgi:hypothetical protein
MHTGQIVVWRGTFGLFARMLLASSTFVHKHDKHQRVRFEVGLGRVLINPRSVSAVKINVRFAPRATEVLHCRD